MTEESVPGEDERLGAELEGVIKIIKGTRGKRFVERFKALGLNPKTDFAGGDWRNCDFSRSDLTDSDFRNSRLFCANFKHAMVDGADFRGAADVHISNFHLSYGWRNARLDSYQIVLIEAQIERMQGYLVNQHSLHREGMTEREWFFAIKACPSFAEAKLILEQMESAGHRLSPYAYSYILDRAKRDHKRVEGWELFNRFLEEGGEPDEALYTAGIGVAPDSQTALEVFNTLRSEMATRDTVPGERAYNMAISKQDNFRIALALFHDMKRKGVPVGRYTVYALFDACQDFANAVTVLMEARKSGIDVNDASFVRELSNTTRYPELSEWNIRKWQSEGLEHRDMIARLVDQILRDPFRREALDTLGFLTPPPSATP